MPPGRSEPRQALEAAGCPGTIRFDNTAGTGLWQTATNWSTDVLPGPTDDTCIPSGMNVTLSSGTQTVNSLFVESGATLAIGTAGTLSLTAASQVDGGLTLSGGILTGAGDATINGTFAWTGGQMTGTGTTFANAGIAFSGAAVKDTTGGRVIETAGTTTWTGGSVRPGSGVVIRNSGTWDVQGDTSFVFLGGFPAQFANQAGATLKKSAGAGTFTSAIPFTNAGTVSALSGTINLAGGGSGAGTYSAGPGAALAFGSGTYTLLAGSTLDAPSVSVATGGILDVFGTYTVTTTTTAAGTARFNAAANLVSLGSNLSIGNGTFDLNSGEAVNLTSLSLTASGATLRGSDTVSVTNQIVWTAGSMTGSGTTNANAGIAFSSAGVKDITTGRMINTAGTTTWSGGQVRPGSGSVIRNSGTWEVQDDTSFAFLGGAPVQFINQSGATFRKTGGPGTLGVSIPFTNAGAVTVESGTIGFTGGGSGTGTYSGTAGTTLAFGPVSYTLASGSTVDVPTVSVATAAILDVFGTYTASTTTSVSGTARFNPAATLVSLGAGLTLSTGILELNSGEPVSLTTLALTGSGATLRGSDVVTVSNPIVWTAGSMTGTGTTNANAGFAFSGSSVKDIPGPRVINTAGTTTWSGGPVRPGSGAVIRNSGVWDVQGDTSMVFLGGARPLFANENGATFKKSAGAGPLRVEAAFTNAGDVSSLAGTIILAAGGSGDGSFSASPGAGLGFEGGTYTMLAGATVDAPAVAVDGIGTLVLSSGTSLDATTVFVGFNATLDVSGTCTVAASTTLSTIGAATARFHPAATLNSLGTEVTLANGVLDLNSGESIALTRLSLTTPGASLRGTDTVTVSDPITWISGDMRGTGTTNAPAGIVFSGTGVKDISEGRILTTGGTTTWPAGQLRPGSGAVIRNSGVWDVQGDLSTVPLGGGTPRFVNLPGAQFRKSAGTGTSSLDMAFDNDGTLSVLAGTVSLNQGGSGIGSYLASPGTMLVFGGGTHSLLQGSSLQAPVVLVGNGATLDVSGTFAVTTSTTVSGSGITGLARFNPPSTVTSLGTDVALPNGILDLNSGDPLSIGTLSLTAAGSSLLGTDTVTVSGPITWTAGSMSGTGTTNANGGIAFGGANVKDITGGRVIHTAGTTTWTGGSVRPGSGALISNAGLWDIQGDTSMAVLPGAPPRFDNLAGGTLRKSAGAGAATSNVPFTNAGVVRAMSGTLSFSGGYTQSAGSTLVEGGVLSSTTPLDIQGGTVGGSGTIAAAVTNAGSLSPGLSPGLLTVAGTWTQTAGATFNVELGGVAPGTAHDKVAVSSAAGLAGTLNVTLVNGFSPADLDTFTIMTYGSSVGSFSAINLPTLGGDLVWKVHHDPTAFVLEVLADLDGDGVRNSTDCRPSDPTVWAIPSSVTGLGFTADGQVTWGSLAAQAGTATVYDVMRGRVSELPVGGGASETCLASGVSTTQMPDTTTPALGTALYYLVRGTNVCGVGTWGTTSAGAEHVTLACP